MPSFTFTVFSLFRVLCGCQKTNTATSFTHPLYHTDGTITDTSLTFLLLKQSFKSWEGSSVATQVSKEQGFIYYCFFQMADG